MNGAGIIVAYGSGGEAFSVADRRQVGPDPDRAYWPPAMLSDRFITPHSGLLPRNQP
jgi:hypothetical protein